MWCPSNHKTLWNTWHVGSNRLNAFSYSQHRVIQQERKPNQHSLIQKPQQICIMKVWKHTGLQETAGPATCKSSTKPGNKSKYTLFICCLQACTFRHLSTQQSAPWSFSSRTASLGLKLVCFQKRCSAEKLGHKVRRSISKRTSCSVLDYAETRLARTICVQHTLCLVSVWLRFQVQSFGAIDWAGKNTEQLIGKHIFFQMHALCDMSVPSKTSPGIMNKIYRTIYTMRLYMSLIKPDNMRSKTTQKNRNQKHTQRLKAHKTHQQLPGRAIIAVKRGDFFDGLCPTLLLHFSAHLWLPGWASLS